MTRRRRGRIRWFLFAGVAAVLFGLYQELTPSVSDFGDSSELTLVLAANGVAHPTGYPLYVLFGHGFVRLAHALGADWAVAASAWSALGAAVALLLLQLLGWELARVVAPRAGSGLRAIAAAAPAVAFGLHPVWVLEATHAEVYTWHVSWALLAAWSFVRSTTGITSAGDPAGDPAASGDPRRHDTRESILGGLLVGAGLAHHRTAVLLLGPLLIGWIVAAARRDRTSRGTVGGEGPGRLPVAARFAIAGGAALVPLASYGLIAFKAFHPAEAQWPVLGASWSDILAHINGSEFLQYIGRFAPDPSARDLFVRWVVPALGIGLLGLIGAAFQAKSGRLTIGTIALATAVSAGVSFAYGVPDPGTYFLMPMALGAAGTAPAIVLLLAGADGRAPRLRRIASGALLGTGLAWLCVVSVQLGRERKEAVTGNDRIVRTMLEALPADSAIVLWPWDAYTKLHEYQRFTGEKPALFVANPALLGYPNARRAFTARFGVDPIAGLSNPRIRSGALDEDARLDELYVRIARTVSAQTHLPVIYMDPEAGILRRLAK